MIKLSNQISAAILGLMLLAIGSTPASALSLIRDAEIEDMIKQVSAPIFAAAGLGADSVNVYLVNDPGVNAFVTGGANIFINTGLILKSENVDELAGVIAHETAHITGGHLIRGRDQIRNSSIKSLLGLAAGLGAALAAKDGQVAQSAIVGSQLVGTADRLQYSRTQESAADQIAVSFLDAAGYSGKGMLSFLKKLAAKDFLISTHPYWRSHPLGNQRIRQLAKAVKSASNYNRNSPFELSLRYERSKAKLVGFLLNKEQVSLRYSLAKQSTPALYAHASHSVKTGQTDKALTYLSTLIERNPNDAYFFELVGQAYFEASDIPRANDAYNLALSLGGEHPAQLASSAEAMIALGTHNGIQGGIELLNRALLKEPDNASYWRKIAVGYAQSQEPGLSSLAMAEANLAMGSKQGTRLSAKRALGLLRPNSPSWIRARDIEIQAANL